MSQSNNNNNNNSTDGGVCQALAELSDQSTNKNKCSVLANVASMLRTFPAAVQRLCAGGASAVQKGASAVQLGASIATDAAMQLTGYSSPQMGINELWQREPVGIFFAGLNLQIFDANEWLYTQLGYTAEELVQIKAGEVMMSALDVVDPDYLHVGLKAMSALLTGKQSVVNVQGNLIHKDGRKQWWIGRGQLFKQKGQRVVVCSLIPISGQIDDAALEARLHSFPTTDDIVHTDPDIDSYRPTNKM